MPLTMKEYLAFEEFLTKLPVKAYDAEHRQLIEYGEVRAHLDKYLKTNDKTEGDE